MNENQRKTNLNIEEFFINRWSPRALGAEDLTQQQIDTLFEAARWAPSCFNDQPWRFVYAQGEDKEALLPILNEFNRAWAASAPLLIFVIANNNFSHNGKPNKHAVFDAGAGWMSLAIQARAMGFYTHAMAGIDYENGRKILNLKDDQELICAVVVGQKMDASTLSDALQAKEQPSGRKELAEIRFRSKLP